MAERVASASVNTAMPTAINTKGKSASCCLQISKLLMTSPTVSPKVTLRLGLLLIAMRIS